MNIDQQGEKLLQYLDGELYAEEQLAFENLLNENAALRQELENLKLARSAVKYYGLKAQVASVHQSMINELKRESKPSLYKSYPFIRNTLKIAASLLIIAFTLGSYQYITLSSAKLAGENYQPYKVSVARDGTVVSALENAYNNAEYKLVIEDFKKIEHPQVKDHFLTAQAYLHIQQPANAIPEFMSVLSFAGQENYKAEAEYYLAISYLENNELLKAKHLFEKIHNDKDHLYHKKVSYFTLLRLNILILKTHAKN